MLKKLRSILIAEILLVAAIVYPLKITDEFTGRIVAFFEEMGPFWKMIWDWQLEPYLFFGLSPLILKWTFVNTLILMLLVSHLLLKLSGYREDNIRLLSPQVILTGTFVLFSALSTLFISPTLHTSLNSLVTLILVALFLIVMLDMTKNRRFLYKNFLLIALISFLLSLIAIMQHMGLAGSFMLKFERARNSMGSLIGHNTGLSSYLMFGWFLSIAVLTSFRNNTGRLITFIFFLILGFIFVAAQSRGVILILGLLTPIYLVYLAKTAGLKIRFKWFVFAAILLALIVTIQVINVPWNPFYSKEAPLLQRLNSFKPENMRGTRLRILTVSPSLIEESPILGHGFASFQYVYPEAQADYYASHTDTILEPTVLRTQRAHNEYLQTAIELGIIGLGLLLAGLYFFLRKGQETFIKIKDIRWKRISCAVFFTITAYLLHSFIDFPSQLPPISMLFWFLLALWASGKSFVSQKRDEPDKEGGSATGIHAKSSGRVILLASALILISLIPLGSMVVLRPYRSDIIFFKSDMFLQTFRIFPDYRNERKEFLEKQNLLKNALQTVENGLRTDPLNPRLLYKSGEASYLLGMMYFDQWEASLEKDNDKNTLLWKEASTINFNKAVRRFKEALEEYRFHSVFYLMAACEDRLDQMNPGKGHRETARDNYALAVRYSPAFALAAKEYTDFLMRTSSDASPYIREAASKEILRIRKMIAKYRPDFFEDYYVKRAREAMLKEEYDKAASLFTDIIRADPEEMEYYGYLAGALSNAGRYDEALEVLQEGLRRAPSDPDLLDAIAFLYIRMKEYDKALTFIRKRLESGEEGYALFEAAETLILREMGEEEEASTRLRKIEEKAKEDPEYLLALARLEMELFGNPEKGLEYLKRRARIGDPQAPAFVYHRIAEYYYQKEQYDETRRYLERALKVEPDFLTSQKLMKQLNNEVRNEEQ